MFTVTEVQTERGKLEYRTEKLTGLKCRISPERLKRRIDQPLALPNEISSCPFCPENIFKVTPVFSDGERILCGESVTFPNMFPFASWHTVTVITRKHTVSAFTHKQIADALHGQLESLNRAKGYSSINWNFLPSAGASIIHPHLQGITDPRPSYITKRYITASRNFFAKTKKNYWDAIKEEERSSERYLFGDEIVWCAHAVPLGEREVRGILPISRLDELDNYIDPLTEGILSVIGLYNKLGTSAFNMAIFFGRDNTQNFSAFCSFISRINPNPLSTSDTAFMERLHGEPVILTLPEELGKYYRNGSSSSD